jgi:cysteinyl-tRNA synthetase
MGITNIDDKILARAAERKVHPADLAAGYEEEFWRDMRALGVSPPDAVLRVTDHVPEIIDYIARIMDNKLAYVVPGSGVYLDVAALGARYGSLGPAHARVASPLEHGQPAQPTQATAAPCSAGHTHRPDTAGAQVSAGDDYEVPITGKRDRRDFALWKVAGPDALPGTAWPSPWGMGRPGWHIECSAMTHAWCGSKLDVHAGGIDLAFPHHCNEIAQSIAFAGMWQSSKDGAMQQGSVSDTQEQGEWVGTWLHTGHLHIAGRKMSKSLKNFVSIRDMLWSSNSSTSSSSATGLSAAPGSISASDRYRMFTAMHGYSSTLSYTPNRLSDAAMFTAKLQEATAGITSVVSSAARAQATALRWTEVDRTFAAAVCAAEVDIASAIRADFDLPAALRKISALASVGTSYAHGGGSRPSMPLLTRCIRAVLDPLCVLGFDFASMQRAGLDTHTANRSTASDGGAGSLRPMESGLPTPAVDTIVRLRGEMKETAGQIRSATKILKIVNTAVSPVGGQDIPAAVVLLEGAQKGLLSSCDYVRDADLPSLGWKLKDTPQGPVLTPVKW